MPRFQTIQDLENFYYGSPLFDKANWNIQKADSNVISTTTGVYNAVFGSQAWVQLNLEANTLGALPKTPWGRSGWRVITARAGTAGTGGVAEDAAIPDTIKPTFAEVSTKPKTIVHDFSVSELHEFLAVEAKDDAYSSMQQLRQYMATQHKEHMNIMLHGDTDTLASNNLESVDRVTMSSAAITSLSYTAADEDMYGIDRSSSTVYDGYINHGSTVDRALTDTLLRTVDFNVRANGGNPTFWLTGHDTYGSTQGLFEPVVRYNVLGEAKVTVGVNGIQTRDGIGFGVNVATIYGMPMIVSKDVVKDTISRVYLLDTSNPEGYDAPRLSIGTAKPTQYFEAGINTGTVIELGRMGNEGMYRTMGELICRFFAAQAQLRDLL